MNLDDLPQPERIKRVPPDELEVDGDNPNEQSDDMFGLLCKNMKQKGWIGNHIVADTNGVIADGEHRWRAAKKIGLEEVPVKFYDIDDSERRLWRQELNKISGEHDKKRDALEYQHLLNDGKADEIEDLVKATGEDLDDLLARVHPDSSEEPGYEYDPEHNVYFEDCVEGMEKRLKPNSVDMVITSPPYNVELGGGENPDKYLTGAVAYQDDMDETEYQEFIGGVLDGLCRVTKPTGHIFFNIHNDGRDGHITPPLFVVERMPEPWRLGSLIVWSKQNTSRMSIKYGEKGRFSQTWEPVFHFINDPDPLKGRRNFDVWNVRQSCDERQYDTGKHPAPFSVELVKEAIYPCTTEGDIILDPFMGSGTTAVAAIETGREYVGFELDEEGAYKPIIERRIAEAKRQVQMVS